VRLGLPDERLFAEVSIAPSDGAVKSMHYSFLPVNVQRQALSSRYAIQKGLFISRCASQRVIPMSRKVASLNPSSSRRERVRRCHSEMRNLS
jgi:hypothetical protein